MEKWVVAIWDNHNPDKSKVVFEGSEEHCQQHARDLLCSLPTDMDCMALSEERLEWCQKFGGGK